MEKYREKAKQNFLDGYNCSQAVLLAFADELGIDKEMACRLSSSFGGGMGRLREVCGAVSGMFMVAGLKYGYDDPKDSKGKTEHYKRIQELAKRFKDQNRYIVCRELLGLDIKTDSYVPSERTQDYYKKRPCADLVGDAADIISDYIYQKGEDVK